jgi:hypothetical protein
MPQTVVFPTVFFCPLKTVPRVLHYAPTNEDGIGEIENNNLSEALLNHAQKEDTQHSHFRQERERG